MSIVVNVNDDELMINLGFRCKKVEPFQVNRKTKEEKKALRKFRKKFKMKMKLNHYIRKVIPVVDKMIIYLKKNDIYPFTTYTRIINQDQIGDVIDMYNVNGKNLVLKYEWNGQTYKAEERPYW